MQQKCSVKATPAEQPRKAYSIPELCKLFGISRAHFYNLCNDGNGPRLMKLGRRTLISAEAVEDWRRQAETPSLKAA